MNVRRIWLRWKLDWLLGRISSARQAGADPTALQSEAYAVICSLAAIDMRRNV